MFELQTPWWEIAFCAALIYLALLVMVRLSGRRTVGQFTPFDLLIVMLLSETVSNGLSGGEQSVTGGLIGAATLVALNVTIAFVTSRNHHAQLLMEGRAVLIGRNGEIFEDTLRRQRIPLLDVEQALREADCSRAEMKFAFLESDGNISVLKNSDIEMPGSLRQN